MEKTIDIVIYNAGIETIKSGTMLTQELIDGTWRTIGVVNSSMEVNAERAVKNANKNGVRKYRNITITID